MNSVRLTVVLSESAHRKIKVRASKNYRALVQEIRAILEEAVSGDSEPSQEEEKAAKRFVERKSRCDDCGQRTELTVSEMTRLMVDAMLVRYDPTTVSMLFCEKCIKRRSFELKNKLKEML